MQRRSAWLHRSIILLAILLSPCLQGAEPTTGYEDAIWALLDARPVLAAAAEITPENYPDSYYATIDQKHIERYREDGTGESQDEQFVKVLTEAGRSVQTTFTLNYSLPYTKSEVVRLEICKPDGRIVPIDIAANSKESIEDSQMGMNIYDSNDRIVRVNIPQLEVGDVIHSVQRTTTLVAVMPGEVSYLFLLEERGYLKHMVVEIHAPADRPLKHIALRDEVPGTVKSTPPKAGNNTLVYRWEATDVPRMFEEPGMPEDSRVLQRVLVTTADNWAAISRWYWQVCAPHLAAVTPEMKQLVKDLTEKQSTDMERIRALFYYVSNNIRYMGITTEKDRPGFEPHDVCTTFDKKYGVCRDKAALLVALLRTAGFAAYPVLLNTGAKCDPEIPGYWFDHAVVSVESKPGEYIVMDPTAENTQELLPAYYCNKSYLVCRPEGAGLKVTPIIPAEKNMTRITTTGRLSAAGTLEARTEFSYEGMTDWTMRDGLAKAKSDDIRRFFEAQLKEIVPGAVLKSVAIAPENMRDTTRNVRVTLDYTAADTITVGGGKAVVSVPWFRNGAVNGEFGLEQRKYPYVSNSTVGIEENVSLQLADEFTGIASLPVDISGDIGCLSYLRRYRFEGNRLNCTNAIKLQSVEYSPAQYLELKRCSTALTINARKTPVLNFAGAKTELTTTSITPPRPVPPVESDVRIDKHSEFTLSDAHNYVVHVRYALEVLTESGKTAAAEFKQNYNPAWDEARLIHARVTSKTGEVHEISPEEIHVMDAGWNASAKRYTGGKTLVANYPGVEIGSRIEAEFEITSHARPYLFYKNMPFSGQNVFQGQTLDLTAPAGLKVQTITLNPAGTIKQETTANGSIQHLHWQQGPVEALPAEPNTPPPWYYRSGVRFFVGDAAVYFKDVHEAFIAHSEHSAKAQALARKLVAKTKTRREGVEAIRDHIATAIRSAGPDFVELPLSELSDADTTLSDGYGHQADRTILFYAMLKAAGFSPEFYLASEFHEHSPVIESVLQLPPPAWFTLPIVRIELDGQPCFLKLNLYHHIGATLYDGNLGLRLADQKLEYVRASQDSHTRTTTDYTIALNDTGQARLTVTRRFFGTDFGDQKKFYSEQPPEERRRYFGELVSGVDQEARPASDLVTRFDSYPGLEQYTVEIDHFAIVEGKFMYFSLPFSPGLLNASTAQRTEPYLIDRSECTIHTEIQLPPGYRHVVIAPKTTTYTAPQSSGIAELSTTHNDGKLVIDFKATTTPAIIPPAEYPDLEKLESKLENRSSRLILLEATGQ